MEIRLTKPEDKDQVQKVRAIAFVNSVNENPDFVENTWGCFSDSGQLTNVVTNHSFDVFYDGSIVKMGGIGGVAALPEVRMQGGVRSIMSEILRRDREKGVAFSALYPFSHTYYRRFGYEICSNANAVRFSISSLVKYRHYAESAQMIESLEDAMALTDLSRQHWQKYNMSVVKNEAVWKRNTRSDYKNAGSYAYSISRKGRCAAYIFFEPRDFKDDREMLVNYYAYDGREGLYALLGFIYKLAAQYKKVCMEIPEDFPINSLIENPYDVAPVEFNGKWMARLVNIEEGLGAMTVPAGDWKCTIKLRDDFLSQNSGVYQLSHSGDGVEVLKIQGDTADLSVTVQTLTQLCLGYLSLDIAKFREDLEIHGNEELLTRIFPSKPVFMSEKF